MPLHARASTGVGGTAGTTPEARPSKWDTEPAEGALLSDDRLASPLEERTCTPRGSERASV